MIMTSFKKGRSINKIKKLTCFFCLNINIFIFLLMFIPMYTKYWIILFSLVNIIYILFHRNIKLIVNNNIVAWYCFISIVLFGIYNSGKNITSAIEFVLKLLLFLLTYILLYEKNDWCRKTVDILFWISSLFVLGSVIELLSPSLKLYINKFNLDETQFLMASEFVKDGYITGFTYQTGINGYAISVFISLIFLKVFTSKDKKMKFIFIILYIFSFYLLLMTGKRGFILFNIIIFLYLITKLTNYKIRSFIPISLSILIIFLFFSYTSAGVKIVQRTLSQLDFTSGRSMMNKIMFNDFLSSPIIGNGTYSTLDAVYAYHGHNIYLQVLREHGILGFIPFMYILIKNFINSKRLLTENKKNSEYVYIIGFSLYMQILFILWGFTGNPLYDVYSLFIYFISIAIISATQKFLKEKGE